MALEHIEPDGLTRPTQYSHVVKAMGTIVFFAGQVPRDGEGNIVGVGDFEAQARQVYSNLRTVLASVGAGFEQVATTTTYVVGMTPEHRAALSAVRAEFEPEPRPADALIGVAALADPNYLLEVQAIAVID